MSEADKTYHVVAINQRTGTKAYLTAYACSRVEACTILRKQSPSAPHARKQLEPVREGSAPDPSPSHWVPV